MNAKQVRAKWYGAGSIYALTVVKTDEITDPHLAHLWGRARQVLEEFEAAENEIEDYLQEAAR